MTTTSLPDATVTGLHLHHTAHSVEDGDEVIDARFARKPDGEKRIAAWKWKENPFIGTREFNGLRVMMAVLNSWDLKNENNAVYSDKKTGQANLPRQRHRRQLRHQLRAHEERQRQGQRQEICGIQVHHSRQRTPTVELRHARAARQNLLMESGGMLAPLYFKRHSYDWIGHDIPRADARWIGSLLGQLSHQQLVDAFRAGSFTPEETNEYVSILEDRIAQLKAL